MKYYSLLPLSALLSLSVMTLLVSVGVIPPGEQLLVQLQQMLTGAPDWLLLLIILAESIIYVGFYFPGQFFAVVIVVLSEPDFNEMLRLTLIMVAAATIGSGVNYGLGYLFSGRKRAEVTQPFSVRNLLLAMLHTNALAFYMFTQGAQKHSPRVIWLAGVINLPWYLVLVAGTALLSQQVMVMAEAPEALAAFLVLWLSIAAWYDWKKWQNRSAQRSVEKT